MPLLSRLDDGLEFFLRTVMPFGQAAERQESLYLPWLLNKELDSLVFLVNC